MIPDSGEAIRRRYGSSRPGMSLVAVVDAAIPVTVVKSEVLAQERKGLPLIEEFILRFLLVGVDTIDELGELLGLDREQVLTSAAIQISNESIKFDSDGRLRLTSVGRDLAREHEAVQPVYEEVEVLFDRLAWEPTPYKKRDLVRRAEAEERGWVVLPPFRSARMMLDDIPVGELNAIVHGANRKTRLVEILKVRRILAQNLHRFTPAKLLVYGDTTQGDVTLDVYLEGGIRASHGTNLAAIDAVATLGIKIESPPHIQDLPKEISGLIENIESTGVEPSVESSERPKVRPVSVFEHPDLLREALQSAKSRLLIISPWIKGQVVNSDFMAQLERRLRDRVRVHIGYGIGRDDKASHKPTIDKLSRLSERFENFTFSRLPNTHAKILIFDQTLVATSFNWLSFMGAEDRTYRMEQGMLITMPNVVEAQYDEFASTIESGDPR